MTDRVPQFVRKRVTKSIFFGEAPIAKNVVGGTDSISGLRSTRAAGRRAFIIGGARFRRRLGRGSSAAGASTLAASAPGPAAPDGSRHARSHRADRRTD